LRLVRRYQSELEKRREYGIGYRVNGITVGALYPNVNIKAFSSIFGSTRKVCGIQREQAKLSGT